MMSVEGVTLIIAGMIVLVYILKSKNKLKKFILRGYK
jgi:hypothetical protein